jgi:spermidine synthase
MLGDLGVISGPIAATILLFLVPGVLMGAISPIAVKLVSLGGAEVGHASGRVSAMGALGSILGTFSAGFVFIPLAGNRAILVGVAVVLAALGMAGFALAKGKLGKPSVALAVTLILGALGATEPPLGPGMHVDKQTFYHRVRVMDMRWGSRLARVLMLDTTHEGAMFLDGDGLPFEYTQYIDLVDLFTKGATRAAFVGGGSFAMPKRFIDRHPGGSAVTFELDPVVVGVGRKYFKTDDYKTLSIVTGDARLNLKRSADRFDLIFGDAYNGISSIPPHLTTLEYYREVRAHLTANGVYMSNIISALEGPHSEFFLATIKTLRKVFPEVYVLPLGSYLAQSQNIILIAPVTATGQGFDGPVNGAMTLTDDHCPVEIMVARQ